MQTECAGWGRLCYDAPTSENEALVSPAGPRLSAGAGGRSPIVSPGRWIDRPSVRPGPGCGKSRSPVPSPGMVDMAFQASDPWDKPEGKRARRRPSRAFLRPQLRSQVNRAQPRTPCSSSQPSRALALRGYGCFKLPHRPTGVCFFVAVSRDGNKKPRPALQTAGHRKCARNSLRRRERRTTRESISGAGMRREVGQPPLRSGRPMTRNGWSGRQCQSR